ncbi:ATP-dependent DNA helicase PIF1 [Linum grandiflorum]
MRLNSSTANVTDSFDGMQFPTWILALGDGNLPSLTHPDYPRSDWIKIPDRFIIPYSTNLIRSLVDRVYPDLITSYTNIAYLSSSAIVAPTNNNVSQINDYILTQLPGDTKVYLNSDTLTTTVIVMLLRNLNPAAGLCNGTRILITHLGNNVICGLIVGGTFDQRQYPLRPCYTMTINKSQGQTLEHIGIYLPTPVFGHNQLYVALSRVRSASAIHIAINDATTPAPSTSWNIMYKEIFEDLLVPGSTV